MKILNTEEFAKLPEGTLFSTCEDYKLCELCIKGKTLDSSYTIYGHDYTTVYLAEVEDCSVTDETDNIPLSPGMHFPVDFSPSHYSFSDKEKFAVWEKEDLLKLAAIVNKALEVWL